MKNLDKSTVLQSPLKISLPIATAQIFKYNYGVPDLIKFVQERAHEGQVVGAFTETYGIEKSKEKKDHG